MSSKFVRLVLLLALLVTSVSLPAQAGDCYWDCFNLYYPAYCDGVPPGPEQQMCSAWIMEICRCQCGMYCP